jgi:mRNA-degrading endonuclease RelE of RelBE toxin-antitoxin system
VLDLKHEVEALKRKLEDARRREAGALAELKDRKAAASLDAKLLQGAEGLYRIKIGTDVRLLYRRKPAGGIEILSLIDRENLGRYVRQYKRRSHP